MPVMIDSGDPAPGDDRLPLLHPEALGEEQREVYEAITGGPRRDGPSPMRYVDGEGRLLGPFNAMLYSPAVGLPFDPLSTGYALGRDLAGTVRLLRALVREAERVTDEVRDDLPAGFPLTLNAQTLTALDGISPETGGPSASLSVLVSVSVSGASGVGPSESSPLIAGSRSGAR